MVLELISNQILAKCMVVELQYKLINENSIKMEAQINSINPYLYTFTIPYYNQYFSYYQHCNQSLVQNSNISYNQYSAYFPSTTQNNQSSSFNPHQIDINTPFSQICDQKSTHNIRHSNRSVQNKKIATSKIVTKQSPKKEGKQKENRNVYSNILRSFFRKISEDQSMEQLIQNIIKKKSLSLTVKQFFDYFREQEINYSKYLRFKKLRYLFVSQDFHEHALIFRILFDHFKTQDLLSHTLTSKKIGKWSVVFHLKGGRELKDKIFN